MSTNHTCTNGVAANGRKVMFFDIDNCLYPKSYRIHDHMADLIDDYFQTHLSLSREDANKLHLRYYKDYGLAIEGLVRHHKIDPLEYNRRVDDALPLDDIIKPNPKLRKLLEDIDRSKVKLWLFTNAYVNHGRRVVRLLEVDDLFEGMTYCDYGEQPMLCKPAPEMFAKAMKQAGVSDPKDCFFVGKSPSLGCFVTLADFATDDSGLNITGAKKYGWTATHLVEPEVTSPEKPLGDYQIASLEELRKVYSFMFKTD